MAESEEKKFPVGKFVAAVMLVLIAALAFSFEPMLRNMVGNQGSAPPPSDAVEEAPAPDNTVKEMPAPDNTIKEAGEPDGASIGGAA